VNGHRKQQMGAYREKHETEMFGSITEKPSTVVYEAAELIPDIVAGIIYWVQWVSLNAC